MAVNHDGHVLLGVGEEWRIGEEGERILARRCSCPRPLLEKDADGWMLCVTCGREPSIRLPAPVGAAEGAPRQRGTTRSIGGS